MKKRFLSILLVIALVIGLMPTITAPAMAAEMDTNLLTEDANWIVVYPENGQHDAPGDQQTGSGEVSQDIVGDGSYPPVYMKISSDKSELAIRVRLNSKDGTEERPQFKNFSFIGIDADCNGTIDFFLGIYNPTGNNGRLGIYNANPTALNAGPSSTGVSGKPLAAFAPVAEKNYTIKKADSRFSDGEDYFLSYSFKVADITAAVEGKTNSTVTFAADTAFCFITGTASQDNSFNQDISGMDKTGWSSGKNWSDLGVLSPPISVNAGFDSFVSVIFDKNTGDTNANPTVRVLAKEGELGTLPAPPTKRAMHFQEWNTNPDGSGETASSKTVINKNTIFYAVWSDKPVCTVTFNPVSGNWGGSQTPITVNTIKGGVGDNMPANPEYTGNNFVGWNTSATANGGTWINAATPIDSPITVFAIWTKQSNNTAKFFDNSSDVGGRLVATLYANGNSPNFNGAMPSLSKPGYTLSSWNSEIGGGGETMATNAAVKAGTWYAQWVEKQSVITYNPNGGQLTGSSTAAAINGKFGIFSPVPIRSGYTFVEWNRVANGAGEPLYPTSDIYDHTTAYAIWQENVLVTFDSNGGKFEVGAPTSIAAIGNKLVQMPLPPTKDADTSSASGYTLLGWNTSGDVKDPLIDLTTTFNESQTLKAVWDPIVEVTFYVNGGKWLDQTTAAAIIPTAYGSVIYLPSPPQRADFAFDGWNTNAAGDGAEFSLNSDVAANLEVHAKWASTATNATVTFNPNGNGQSSTQVAVTVGEQVAEPTSPIRTGYTFGGWYKEAGCVNAWNLASDTVTQNITLYAKWIPNTYKVTYQYNGADGGDRTAEKTVTYGAVIGTLPTPTKTGNTLEGWYDNSAFEGSAVTENTTVTKTENFSLYAKWNSNAYMVSAAACYKDFNNSTQAYGSEQVGEVGGTVSGGGSYVYGDNVTLTAIAAEGYRFTGWYPAKDGTATAASTDAAYNFSVQGDLAYYGRFEQKSFGVTVTAGTGGAVQLDNGTAADSVAKKLAYGTAIRVSAIADVGYTFSGWSGSLSGTNNPETVTVGGVTTATAVFVQNGKITFDSTGGMPVADKFVSAGSMVGTLPSSTKEGYRFEGWYLPDGVTKVDETYSMPQEGLTLTAKWKADSGYEVEGTVEDKDNRPVVATVELQQSGSGKYGPVPTAMDGKFIIHGVAEGIYNLVIKYTDGNGLTTTVTQIIDVRENLGAITIKIPEGNKNTIFSPIGGVPVDVVGELDKVFGSSLADADTEGITESDLDHVTSGGSVTVTLLAQPADENTQNNQIQAVGNEISKNAKLRGLQLDLTPKKEYFDGAGNPTGAAIVLTKLNNIVKVYITLPQEAQGRSGYVVYRYHGGKVDTITTTKNSNGEFFAISGSTLQLNVQLFSVYALGYDPEIGQAPSNTGGGKGTPSATYTVETKPTNGGTVTPSTATVSAGGSVTLTFTPKLGATLVDVTINGVSMGAPNQYTITNVKENQVVKARFVWNLPYWVGGNGVEGETGKWYYLGYSSPASGEMKWIENTGKAILFHPNPKDFEDLRNGHWGMDSINFVTERELFVGVTATEFEPEIGMTRAMFATVIGRLHERSNGLIPEASAKPFDDVAMGKWYTKYVAWADVNGVVLGIGEEKFAPERTITRQEMAAMLARYISFANIQLKETGTAQSFGDLDSVSGWAKASVAEMKKYGIIQGNGDNLYTPKKTATRAEVAQIFRNFIELTVQ